MCASPSWTPTLHRYRIYIHFLFKMEKRSCHVSRLSATGTMLIVVVLCLLLIGFVECQRDRPFRKQPPKIDRPGHANALVINYPLQFFDAQHADKDWRKQGQYSPSLVAASESTRAWSEHSYAQDQEDVWLYENWFYGMSSGLIMESGALDGILFSNSHMFESFANWTALHVGELLISHLSSLFAGVFLSDSLFNILMLGCVLQKQILRIMVS